MSAQPLAPLGVGTRGPSESFSILPPGARPTYCFAVAGLARGLSTYIPVGLDYCALAKALLVSRDTGQSSYAPFVAAKTMLGVETPVYRGGLVPPTVAARRRAFVGWLGELLVPEVVLRRALEGHAATAAIFRYENGSSHATFHAGTPSRGAQAAAIDLHNGWHVETFGPRIVSSVTSDPRSEVLLYGGALVSLLLGLLVFVLGTGRRRALSLVREKTRELSHQALHDTLTGLPNRALVLDRAEQMLARTARQARLVAGALFIDVDGFKHVNDNLGHASGDELLRVVGERLLGAVRDQDTVGRLGGDEFVVLVETSTREAPIEILASRLIEALRAPAKLGPDGKTLSFTVSIGVAAGRYGSPDELLRDADLALYAAKAAGKDRYALFDSSMAAAGEGPEVELELSAALWDGQLYLDYQPIYDVSRQTAVGAEALLRWRHPDRGVVAPGEFIAVAEESGLIVPIGRWVLEEACRQAAGWSALARPMGISVNVSASQLAREEFAADVRAALRNSGLEPSLLTLEVTETTVMRDVTVSCERLEELQALGVRVAIDDFGTGYASLAHLQRIPADVLKIDRSFVQALNDGGQSRELLEAIFGVARALSLTVIAEGIEEESQLKALREMGCEMAQGFLLGRPGPPEDTAELLGAATASEAGVSAL